MRFLFPSGLHTTKRQGDNQNVFDGSRGSFGGEDSPKEILDEKSPSKFRYIKEIIGENSAVLEFESEIDGIYVNGIDLISWNEENKITEFKVIVRPLQAVNRLHQQMQDMLEKMKTA